MFRGKIRLLQARIRRFWLGKADYSANGCLLVNPGNFWCDKCWSKIVASQSNIETAIDPAIAAMGVGRALEWRYARDSMEGPLERACEMLPPAILAGILERSRGWL